MNRDARSLIVVLTLLAGTGAQAVQQRAASSAGLKIVVIEGEGSVNIIQQKTAVAPLVEVRDRNDLPVSGAVVTFTIGGGKTAAFAGGSQTLTVMTNAAGRAVAALNPLTNGTVQIQVSAAFQGQTSVATIAQTNVLTAAQASAASGAASGSGSSAATAGAAGGGGGISATTVGIVAGVVGGGAVAAATALDVFKGSTVYSGDISVRIEETTTSTQGGRVVLVCTNTDTFVGTIKITLEEQDSVKGELEIKGTSHRVGSTCQGSPPRADQLETISGPVTGTTGNITFEHTETSTSTLMPLGGGAVIGTVTQTEVVQFTGSLSGDVISGTLSHSSKDVGVVDGGGGFVSESSTRVPVTLRKAT